MKNCLTHRIYRPLFRWKWILLALALFTLEIACDDPPPDLFISQFDRPQDVAFVCYDTQEKTTQPLECCRRSADAAPGSDCPYGLPSAKIYAFVTQTTPGEVAVVDLEAQRIVDQEKQIPYNTFIPVGGQPSDIAVTWDGSKVYTANFETSDLTSITVIDEENDFSVFDNPSIEQTTSINLQSPAARLVLANSPIANRDRFAFVTLPLASRLAVVALNGNDCPSPDLTPNGCVLGYLPLNSVTGLDETPDNPVPEGIRPWSIIASDLTHSLYVSGTQGEFILEIAGDFLVDEALELTEPGELSDKSIIRRIETEGFTIKELALEPNLERWIYAIDNQQGDILAIDLVEEEILPLTDLRLPGKARAIALVRLGEGDDDPGPLTFNGTFAVVSTTTAEITVIDVDDENGKAADPNPPYHDHAIRSAVDLSAGTEDEDPPRLAEEPLLTVDDTKIPEDDTGDYAFFYAFEDTDAGVPEQPIPADCPDDNRSGFRPGESFGFRFRCDPRESQRELWQLVWEGSIGLNGAGSIIEDLSSPEDGYIVIRDTTKDFCEDGLNSGRFLPDDYPGDLLVVYSEPDASPECAEKYGTDTLVYQVTGVLDADGHLIRVANNTPGIETFPLPTVECFGTAFNYQIRAFRHWIAKGSKYGHLYDGTTEYDADKDEYSCVTGPEEAVGRSHRVWPDEPFENYTFTFTLKHGENYHPETGKFMKQSADMTTYVETEVLYYTFETTGGFRPLATYLGNNITDIDFTPDSVLVLIDQAGQGLIIFDMINNFEVLGTNVN